MKLHKQILASITAGLVALSGSAVMASEANAAPGKVSASYGCGSVTFSNGTTGTVRVIYGTAQSDDIEGEGLIKAGQSKTVTSSNKHFGWSAKDSKGNDLYYLPYPGEDVSRTSARCKKASGAPTKSSAQKSAPEASGGLASTGE